MKRTSPGHGVVDLRTIFTNRDDYTHTVEPSAQGGEKPARAIADAVVPLGMRLDSRDQKGKPRSLDFGSHQE